MIEENYYVKVVVDGVVVPDSNLCGGSPTASACTYKVGLELCGTFIVFHFFFSALFTIIKSARLDLKILTTD